MISSVSGTALANHLGLLATPIAPLKNATLKSSQAAAYWVDPALPAKASIPRR